MGPLACSTSCCLEPLCFLPTSSIALHPPQSGSDQRETMCLAMAPLVTDPKGVLTCWPVAGILMPGPFLSLQNVVLGASPLRTEARVQTPGAALCTAREKVLEEGQSRVMSHQAEGLGEHCVGSGGGEA